MTRHSHWLAVSAVFLGIGLGGPAASGSDSPASGPDLVQTVPPTLKYPELFQQDVRYLRDELSRPQLDKQAPIKLRGTALALAMHAQISMREPGTDRRQLADLRAGAVRLTQALSKNDWDQARGLVRTLSEAPVPDVTASLGPLPLHTYLHSEDVSRMFVLERKGGYGIEMKLILKWVNNRALMKTKQLPPAAFTREFEQQAQRTLLIAELLKGYVPKKDVPIWQTSAEGLRTSALEVVAAARKKDSRAAFTALTRMDSHCCSCHTKHRDCN